MALEAQRLVPAIHGLPSVSSDRRCSHYSVSGGHLTERDLGFLAIVLATFAPLLSSPRLPRKGLTVRDTRESHARSNVEDIGSENKPTPQNSTAPTNVSLPSSSSADVEQSAFVASKGVSWGSTRLDFANNQACDVL